MRLPKGRVPRQQRYTASVPSAARYESCARYRAVGSWVRLWFRPARQCYRRLLLLLGVHSGDDRVTEIDAVAGPSGRSDARSIPRATARYLGDRRFERVPSKRRPVVKGKRGGSRDGRGRRPKGTGAMGGPLPLPPPAGGRRRSRSQRTRYCRAARPGSRRSKRISGQMFPQDILVRPSDDRSFRI